jgi:aminobenzoyl-glutamate utilization protein A
MTEDIERLAMDMQDGLIRRRRDLHRHPEAAWTEFRTASTVAAALSAAGYEVRLGEDAVCRRSMLGVPPEAALSAHMERAAAQGGDPELIERMRGGLTGVVGELRRGEGPVVALRFDMDANGLEEARDHGHRPAREGFASANAGVMHACGHDGHVAMGLGVAELLAGLKDRLRGTVRLIFQPGEEGVRGAGPMIDAGALDWAATSGSASPGPGGSSAARAGSWPPPSSTSPSAGSRPTPGRPRNRGATPCWPRPTRP